MRGDSSVMEMDRWLYVVEGEGTGVDPHTCHSAAMAGSPTCPDLSQTAVRCENMSVTSDVLVDLLGA